MLKTLEEREKLLAELLAQHNGLRRDLAEMAILIPNASGDAAGVEGAFNKFKTCLLYTSDAADE